MVVHSKPMDLQSPKLVLEMVHGEDTRVSRGSGASGSDGQLKTPTLSIKDVQLKTPQIVSEGII